MRSLLLISALQVLAAAIPHPYASEDATTPAATLITLSGILPTSTVATPDSTSLNIPVTAVPDPDDDDNDDSDDTDADGNPISRTKKPHKEPIPVFTKQCQCQLATARYPCWATDALQRCYFEENFSHACYMQAAGGCPRPTRACGKLYKPTPRPGPNPCELAPNPHVTSAPHIITNFSTLTGAPNVTLSLPVVPTKNNTFTTMTASGTL